MNLTQANQYRKMIEQAAVSLPDEDALTVPELFPHWESGISVTADKRYYHEGKLYKVVQGHTTQEEWEPDKTPALWTEVAKPGEIPVWKQPTGAQDAYMTGDKVHYPTENDPVYSSLIDNNVWVPTTAGLWEQQT